MCFLKWTLSSLLYHSNSNEILIISRLRILFLEIVIYFYHSLAGENGQGQNVLVGQKFGGWGGNSLICSICWCLWCKYSHHGWFQATNIISHERQLREDTRNHFSQAGVSSLQHTTSQTASSDLLSTQSHQGQWGVWGWEQCCRLRWGSLAHTSALLPDHSCLVTPQRRVQNPPPPPHFPWLLRASRHPFSIYKWVWTSITLFKSPQLIHTSHVSLPVILIVCSSCSIYPNLLKWITNSVKTKTISHPSLGSFAHLAQCQAHSKCSIHN